MIFPLELSEVLNSERIFVNLLSRQPHSYGQIKAILDTGSPTTIISCVDALRLNLPLDGTETGEPIAGFGRGQIPSKKIKKFIFALKSNENNINYLEMPVHTININALKNMNQDIQNNTMKIPTIINTTIELKIIPFFFTPFNPPSYLYILFSKSTAQILYSCHY
ncbi:MAG: hypothetical protein AABX11_06130 [Nanoarchaeota archaeon]